MAGTLATEGPAAVETQQVPVPDDTVYVDVSVPDSTSIAYSIDPVYVTPGDLLVWQSDLPFSLQFKEDSPIYGGHTPADEDPAGVGATLRFARAAVVRLSAARPESYPYTVAVFLDGVGVLIDDPEVIVDPDPADDGG